MGTHLKLALAAAAIIATAACTVKKADEGPDLFGPSDFALALDLFATPDSITQDGASQSSIVVTAHDSTGSPKAGIVVRLDIEVAGVVQDFGSLSRRTVVTGTDGRATAIYTAPAADPFTGGLGRFIRIVATPSGTNTQALMIRTAEIRLIPPGVILPPAGAPTAEFTATPVPIVVGVSAFFDASMSQVGSGASQIETYQWSFGDGDTATGRQTTHTFDAAGTYLVTLTVTNDRGVAASTSESVAVQAAGPPQANFTVSPEDITTTTDVFFNGTTSTAATGRTIVSYSWDFGDGTTATGATPDPKRYSLPNTYTVTLTVEDDLGQEDSSSRSVTVDP
jgi:PKD repeat protein